MLDDGEAEARATGFPGTCRVDAIETLEDAGPFVLGDARSLVADTDLSDGTQQLPDLTDGDGHARTVGCIAHRVVDQVVQRRDQLPPITDDANAGLATTDQVERPSLG